MASGRYHSTSEVIREGIRLVEESEKRLEALYAALDEGTKGSDEGRVFTADEIFPALRQRIGEVAGRDP